MNILISPSTHSNNQFSDICLDSKIIMITVFFKKEEDNHVTKNKIYLPSELFIVCWCG